MKDSIYIFDFKNILKYLIAGVILTLIHVGISELNYFWYFIELFTLPIMFYFVDYFFSKPKKSIQKPIILNSLTCNCHICVSWRKSKKMKPIALPIILILLIFTMYICVLNKAYNNMTKGLYPKKSIVDTEFKIKFGKLETSLRTRLENNYYEINKIGNEVIDNQKGSYYIVDLKLQNNSETFFFNKGEYIIREFDKKLYKPLNEFIDKVYSYLDAGAECNLYIKGSADNLSNSTLNESFVKEYDDTNFRKIGYFPMISIDKYIRTIKFHSITGNYKNSDLPFLRSVFLREKIINTFKGIPKPDILEGFVEKKISDKERNVTLIMYVNFDKKKFLD